MSWKKIPYHRVPRWVKRKKRAHVKGRTYLYRKRRDDWYKKLRGEWEHRLTPWQYILVGFLSTLAAALIAGIIVYWISS